MGSVVCTTCDGHGTVVSANITTRKSSHSTEFQYKLGGLDGKHFTKLPGDMLHQDFQDPSGGDIVLQRQSLEP